MFCTRCGNQIDPGKNFCPKCGARTAKTAEPAAENPTLALEPLPAPTMIEERTQFMSEPSSIDETLEMPVASSPRGRGRALPIAVIAGVVVIAAGAGVYFGTDLWRQSPKQETSAVAQLPATTTAPPLPPVEEPKVPSETKEGDLWSTVQPAPPEPQPPIQAEPAKPLTESKSKPMVPAELPTEPRRPQRERAQPTPPPSTPSSQVQLPANPGTYETIRPTNVFAEPSPSSRIVSNIDSGIRVAVVAANSEWLEVRSRFGNPPGFIRRTDTKLIGRAD